jgi:DNA end-binding protein Ku
MWWSSVPIATGSCCTPCSNPDELRQPEFSRTPCGETEGELAICKQLIEALAAGFEPNAFRDAYQENVLRLIQSKIEGKAIVLAPAPKKPAAPADLLAALQQSIAEAKASKKLLA